MAIHILVVEDDRDWANNVCRKLEASKSFQALVQYAESGDEAINITELTPIKFDVFLIDMKLGMAIDGLDLIRYFSNSNPQADFILMTGEMGTNNPKNAHNVIQAGATYYLPKPFRFRELEGMLENLIAKRDVRRERNWLETILDVSKQAQNVNSLQELGKILTMGGKKLGYERARFWERIDEDNLKCVATEGHTTSSGDAVINTTMQISISLTAQKMIHSHNPCIFEDDDCAKREDGILLSQRFKLPEGQWVAIPLRFNNYCVSILALDNAGAQKHLQDEEKHLLQLLNQQANASLAQIQERQQRYRLELINRLGGRVNEKAAIGNLKEIFEEIQSYIRLGVKASNLIIALLDPISEEINLELVYIDNVRIHDTSSLGIEPSGENGMIGHLIRLGETILLPLGTESYRQRYGIELVHKPALSWVGVPLKVGNRVIGAIVLEDDHKQGMVSEADRDFLEAATDIVAGAVETVRSKQNELWQKEQLRLLHYASEQILRFAEKPDKLWFFILVVIKVVCGEDCTEWLIFLKRNSHSPYFRGERGLKITKTFNESLTRYFGQDNQIFDLALFVEHLEEDKVTIPFQFDESVRSNTLINTELFEQLNFLRGGDTDSHKVVMFAEADAAMGESLREFKADEYVLFSVRPHQKSQTMGVIIIGGNSYLTKQLPVNHLTTFLQQIALSLQAYEDRAVRDDILKVQPYILSEVINGEPPALHTILCNVAEVVRRTIQADRVAIHPLIFGSNEFDTENFGFALRNNKLKIPRPPRPDGLSNHVLRTGKEIISDVNKFDDTKILGGAKIRKEDRKSIIGWRIEAPITKQPLGIIYVDYTFVQDFSNRIQEQVALFAQQAGQALQNYWERIAREEKFESNVDARNRMLTSIQLAQKSTLEVKHLIGNELENIVVPVLLESISNLFLEKEKVKTCLVLCSPIITFAKSSDHKKIKRHFSLTENNLLQQDDRSITEGLTGEVIKTGKESYISDVTKNPLFIKGKFSHIHTKTEFDIPISLDNKVVGLWNIESSEEDGLSPYKKDMVRQFTHTTATILQSLLASENLRKEQARLTKVLKISQAVSGTLEPDKALYIISEELTSLYPNCNVAIFGYDADRQLMKLVPASKDFYPIAEEVFTRYANFNITQREEGVVSYAARCALQKRKTEILNVPDVLENEFHLQALENTRSELVSAFVEDGQLLGALLIESGDLNRFSLEDETLLKAVVDIVATVLARGKEKRELEFKGIVANNLAWVAETAHESKGEIGKIQHLAGWIREDIEGSNKHILQILDGIDQCASNLSMLMSAPANESLTGAGKYSLQAFLTKETLELVQRQGHEEMTEINYNLPEVPIFVRHSQVSFRRILAYLVNNALEALERKYEEPFVGKIIVGAKILDEVFNQESMVKIWVEDNGPGIDHKLLPNILFEPNSTREGKHRGYGLVFARMLAQGLGGEMWLDSELEEIGARFAFRIPFLTNE